MISEEYRIASKKWVKLDADAREKKELKSIKLAELMAALTDVPTTAERERIVKSSPQWRAIIIEMVSARTEANMARVRMKWTEIRHAEEQSKEATARAEMRL